MRRELLQIGAVVAVIFGIWALVVEDLRLNPIIGSVVLLALLAHVGQWNWARVSVTKKALDSFKRYSHESRTAGRDS